MQLHEAPIAIGRAPSSAIAFIGDDAVSTRHALMERRPVGWSLRDLAQSNGTYVNGAKLVGERILMSGDKIAH